jgi:hypothetical protein
MAAVYAPDADGTNAFGVQRHARAQIRSFVERVFRTPQRAGVRETVDSIVSVRFPAPTVDVAHQYGEQEGQQFATGEPAGLERVLAPEFLPASINEPVRSRAAWIHAALVVNSPASAVPPLLAVRINRVGGEVDVALSPVLSDDSAAARGGVAPARDVLLERTGDCVVVIAVILWYSFSEHERAVEERSGGVQEVKITVGEGYSPDPLAVMQGRPVRPTSSATKPRRDATPRSSVTSARCGRCRRTRRLRWSSQRNMRGSSPSPAG